MERRNQERVTVLASVVVIAAAGVLAAFCNRGWSWELFLWGPAVGLAAAGWAYGSTRMLGRYLQARATPAEAAKIREQAKSLGSRQRSNYVAVLAFGIAAGILAGGLHSAAVDVVFAALWLVVGVLPPLVAAPILTRRVGHARGA